MRAMKKIEDIFKSLEEVALDLSVSKGEVSNNDTLNLSRQIILATPRPDPIGSNDSDIFMMVWFLLRRRPRKTWRKKRKRRKKERN